jgi:type IV pilus assembly protein PilQ
VKLNFASVKTQDQRPIRAAPRQENHRDSTNNSLAHSGISQPINSSYATIAALFRPSAGRLIELELLAMQAEDRGQVISNPRLLATDQSEATIEEGSEIPYSHTSRRGAMSTSFKKAALSLRIKPRIASDMSSIWLDVEISKDSPNYHHLNYSGAPSVDTKRIHTQVQIENGGTVVLGGIFIDEQNQQETKVPLLGDIPVLGWLFRSRHTRQQRRELLVFITPKIISNP